MESSAPASVQATLDRTRLTPAQLRWRCPVASLPFETTDDVDPANTILGQPTAGAALKFGIECMAPGQNIYVRGPRGTGRITMVRKILEELQPKCDDKRDYAYVHHFARPEHPRLITLPPGTAPEFRRQLSRVAEFLEEGLFKALDSEPHTSMRQTIQQQMQDEIREATDPLEQEIQDSGMALVSVQQGPTSQTMILPVVDGQPVPADQLRLLVEQEKAPAEQLAAFEEALPRYQKRLQETGRRVNQLIGQAAERLRAYNEQVARKLVEQTLAPVRAKYTGADVREYLDEVVDDVVRNQLDGGEDRPDLKQLYSVNVVLTQTDPQARPVIFENTPSLINLLGTVEPEFHPSGMAVSDFRGIHGGALLLADRGYLILEVNELLSEPGAWRALMRTLRTGRLEIVPPEVGWMRQTVVTVPQSIDIQVRVILIGDSPTYYELDRADPDFRELFKVLADFDSQLPRNEHSLMQYASVVAELCRREGLPPFDRQAVAELVEHGARIVARADRLTSRFGRIADIARESAYLAGTGIVQGDHVIEAVRRTKQRASLPSIKFFEMVKNRTIMVETEGAVVGQINGLAVMRSGPLTYGFPARITATIGPGNVGLIDIEGRAQMSGSIHTKGFHILGGLLRHLLRTEHPMAFTASLAFEQSYGGIDGDSASAAEIICLLSALTGIPILQSMAITGAIDQHGHIEAIGGVNEKIEGFFDACQHFGLTGQQGVVIPESNAGDLMLRRNVVEAAERGEFRVHTAATIYDALELMTGVVAGEASPTGEYSPGSLLAIAHDEVEKYWRMSLANPQALPERPL